MMNKSTAARSKRYGPANQIAYEQSERSDRNATLARMAAQKKARIAGAAKIAARTASTTGMNAGTLGGAYLASFQRKKK